MQQKKFIKGLVSIGIPTYNRPDFLNQLLKNLTKQTYTNIEIIISDNNSPNTRIKEIIDLYENLNIKYFRQENNIGVLANADFVLQKANGEYFTWISDDDWRSPEFIENMVLILESKPNIDFAFCDYYEVYENGERAKGYPYSHLKLFNSFQSKFRFNRIISYYWQNSKKGKCNLFYSVFRTKILKQINIQELTEDYIHLNMDNLIVFKMIQSSQFIISSDVMCTLTCGNEKYYTQKKEFIEKIKLNPIKKILSILYNNIIETKLYIKNTKNILEKFVISFLFIPKFIIEINTLIFENIFNKIELKNSNNTYSLKSKIDLNDVTLVAVATKNVEETLCALKYSSKEINFNCIKLLSHYTPFFKDENIEFCRIKKMANIDEWSYFIVYELHKYIKSKFILLVHADGFVVNPTSWRKEFLNYDYIGAPWPLPLDNFSYRDINGNVIRVGNSVSIRSKKILELPSKLNIPWEADSGFFNEDGFLCVKNKHILEKEGVKFAPLEIAKYFSHETMIPEIKNIKPFVFHKWYGSNSKYPNFNKTW